ncbi:dentin sialophosphoprotein isoform X1 [Spatholobus suberectus]|nr:dentin sialophosphoprotein isoform X1 [Spatholobus suberectus]
MGFGLSLRKKSSKQQSRSKTDKESSDFPQPNPCPGDSLKLKSKSSVGQASSDPCNKAKQDVIVGKVQHRDSAKGSSTQPDELVKYMSNLPDFLKRSDGGENIQGKALNVGVLDWSQLEKWKNKKTNIKAEASNSTSFISSEETSSRAATTSSSATSGGHNKKIDGRKGLSSSRIKGSYEGGLPSSSKMSSQNVKRYQHSETETKTIGDEHRMSPREFGKTQSDTSLQRVKVNDYDEITSTVGSFASKSRHHGVSLAPNENSIGRDVEDKRMESFQQHSLKKKERNLKSSSDKGHSSLESKYKGVSFDSQEKMSSSSSKAKKKMDQWQESYIDVGHKQSHGMPSNIVLLRPRRVLQSKSGDYFQHSQSRTSYDEDFSESSRSSLSYISLPEEVYTEDVHAEIPHSSALPSVTELASSSETLQYNINTDPDIDRSSVVSKKPSCSNNLSSLQSEDTSTEKDMLDIKVRNQCAFSNMLESQDHETAELTAQNPSSNRRLSFSLNQFGSFSFKEGSIPKLSSMYVSAKSGPVSPESSACLDDHSKGKVKGHNRTRSSPLLRLLDPIWKHKASNIHHSDEHSVTSKGSMDSTSLRTINLPDEKSKESSIQALLQLKIRNGAPLFKFVLNSERKVLAATMKSLALPEKDDVDCYFTFYLVNEIKKKSGKWKSQWSKEKNCGYVYNIVGQMKVSSSKTTESSNENSKRESVVKEYVLMGVEVDQLDQEPPKFFMSKELAAVVIEIPCGNISHEGLLYSHNLPRKRCLKCLADEKCFCSSQENDIYGNITVILPGGVHSSPNTGEPSPLIHRWKLGGLCDCGGWDVGCKLLVLSNQNLSSNIPRSFEKFHLFVQEGTEQDTPLFTLVPFKDEFYSVEFNSTVNHLQAFFISVAILSSQKLPSSLEMNNMQEAINKEFCSKNNNELQGKAPLNYNPIPPYSPADRV